MGWQGADWLERSEREVEEEPDKALDALGSLAGLTVADVGAGRATSPSGWLRASDPEAACLPTISSQKC
jgi:hypothetical protein